MVIYVDVLLFTNTVVDFLLLNLTSVMSGYKIRKLRLISGALSSALFSLAVFLPSTSCLLEVLLRIASSVVGVTVTFGFKNLKRYTVCLLLFYAVSFIYAGLMMGIYMIFEPKRMSVNNEIVYFDISALSLIVSSLVFYLVIVIAKKLIKRNSNNAARLITELEFLNKKISADAMVDTGHSLTDAYDGSSVIIIDRVTAEQLFGFNDTERIIKMLPPQSESLKKRFRLLPVKTVSSENLMPAVKIDKAIVNGKYTLDHPVAVISNGYLSSDYSVIISPAAAGTI